MRYFRSGPALVSQVELGIHEQRRAELAGNRLRVGAG